MRVLLLSPDLDRAVQRADQRDKLGLLYLASALEQENIQVRVLDRHLEQTGDSELREVLLAYRPAAVGVSIVTETVPDAITCAKLVKESLGDIPVVAGGPHPTLAAEDLLAHVKEFDYCVMGEGERAFPELLETLGRGGDVSAVDGLAYRRPDGEVVRTAPRELIPELDDVPFPARDHSAKYSTRDKGLYYFQDRYPGRGPVKMSTCLIVSSRGCPFKCSFCASSVLWRSRWRARSPGNVIAELEQLKRDYGVDMVEISDDAFTLDKARAERICDLMVTRKLDIRWNTHIRVDQVTYDLLKLMRKAGCYYVSYGVESGSQRILDEIVDKKLTVERVVEATRWLDELGYLRHANFMISHPTETREDARKTLELMDRLGGKNNLGITVIYPGTRVEKLARERGLLPADSTWTRPVESPYPLPLVKQGLPYFVDTLPWKEGCAFLFDWASRQGYTLRGHGLRALKNINSVADLRKALFVLLVYLGRLSRQAFCVRKEKDV